MPSAAVVGIGDELLSGIVVNTNASMIGQKLIGVGVPVVLHAVVGDVEDEMIRELSRACELADVVIVTGGLGPTPDDRTRDALARLLGVGLVRDESVVEALRRRFGGMRGGRPMPESNVKQADRPEGTDFIPNPVGTAPGIRAVVGRAVVYCIPGVPREAERILDDTILPELAQRFAGAHVIRSRDLRSIGIAESELADRLNDLATAEHPRMAFLPGGGEVRLRFVATGPTAEQCEADLDRAEATVRERLGASVYGGEDTLEGAVGALLAERGETVATAESCTAGLLAARMAAVPGATEWLRGGLVTYQNDVKAHSLGISPSLVEAAGPVSGEVAVEMARGARIAMDADIGVAITCSAAPAPSSPPGPAPVGTTFVALAGPTGAPVVRELRLPGDRPQVRQFAVTQALNLLRLWLQGETIR